ncbi:MAG: preprotein translocase subunit YajC [Muribaculaceae bacterium]|nr:preprotein translocase subunit YajC [Muribaculaceae bacterium]
MNILNAILLQAQGGQGSSWTGMLMIVAMIAIFYFFMIRPQQKKQKEIKKQRDAMTNGDRVVTAGGIHGRIKEIKENTIMIEIAPSVSIKVDKNSVYPMVEEQPKK